ncbi:MAG: ComF family protein [Puniceicoccales bacterium]|nr:ComF family protein [Puniceicoccales bacterium]
MQTFLRLAHPVLDFLYPRSCLFCLRTIQGTETWHTCESCRRSLEPRGPSSAQFHGSSIKLRGSSWNPEPAGENDLLSSADNSRSSETPRPSGQGQNFPIQDQKFSSRSQNFPLRQIHYLWNFRGLPREWIHALKYRDGEYLVTDLEKILRQHPEWSNTLAGAILVPVPLHWRRLWQRDYNQSEVIARALSQISGSPVMALLRRRKNSPSQTQLSPNERRRNVEGAFALHRRAGRVDRGRRLILVDDVLTTGATAQACAAILFQNGFRTIDVVALAHG